MDILVYGAGVCGSYIASELFLAKQNVTLLARGKRLEFLRENGVIIKHSLQKSWTTAKIPVIDRLRPEAYYDVVFIVMKKTQLEGALPSLEANKKCPLYIFLGNNGDIRQACRYFSDASRVAFGFPCSGGRIDKGIVYSYHKKPVLTLGETMGRASARLSNVAELFKKTAVRVKISPNIDAFLKYHLALVSPLANAIQRAGGDMKKLAASGDEIKLLVTAIKEGVGVLEALGLPGEPPSAVRLLKMPAALLSFFLRRAIAKESAGLAMRDHAMAATDEMAALADEFKALTARTNIATPSIDSLYSTMLRPKA
jgi:2-dehydropantoate 2-reductase